MKALILSGIKLSLSIPLHYAQGSCWKANSCDLYWSSSFILYKDFYMYVKQASVYKSIAQ